MCVCVCVCVCQIHVIIATHILPKAGWNLVFRSCSRLGVEVNSPSCTAQNSTMTIKFGACSAVLILLLPNELAQVMTTLNYLQKILLSQFLLRHWLIVLQRNVSVRDLAYIAYDQPGTTVCHLPNTPVSCMLTAHTAHQLSLQRPVVPPV